MGTVVGIALSALTSRTLTAKGSAMSLPAPQDQPDRVEVRPGDRDTARRVDAWFHHYQQTRDPRLREQIICAYLGLADRLAERFRTSRGTSPEDLVQTARTGLVAAVDRYDPTRGTPFVPFAVACVVGELKRHLRDTTWRVHVARPIKERALRLARALDDLDQQLGHSPTIAELAAHLDEPDEAVIEAMEALRSRAEPSLDQPAQPTSDGEPATLGELLAAPQTGEDPDDLLLLPELVARLPDLERQVIVLRFVQELTQDQIADRIGYSQMHVSRLLRRAIDRMRTELLVA
jgi:RNA polymerase sigma-B factor